VNTRAEKVGLYNALVYCEIIIKLIIINLLPNFVTVLLKTILFSQICEDNLYNKKKFGIYWHDFIHVANI
jgi:hypothetical protein